MTSLPSDRPVSALRARMIEDMSVHGFSEKTPNDYIRNVRAFAGFGGRSPDTATAEDLRRFQHHQAQTGVRPPSINSAVAALRFFFTVTLDRPDLARRLTVVREPCRLPAVLSVEEVTLLLQAAPGPKYKAAFATAGACPRAGRRPDPWGAGLRVSEVVALKVGNVDSERVLLRVKQGKGRKGRQAMLSPQLLGLLRRNRHCPNHLHFTPTSASWINQVERFFALLTEKQIRRGVHRSVDELDQRSTALSRRTTKRQSPSDGRNPLTRSLPASNAFEWPEPINGY